MADTRKISELHQIPELDDQNTQFLAIDTATTDGADASTSGKTSRVKLWQLRDALETSGPKGSRGETGDPGTPGKDGSDGRAGDKGPRGPTGDHGDDGAIGQDGETGEQGIQGIPGPRGFEGEKGSIGPKGPRGSSGIKGSTSSVNDTLSLVKSDSLSWDSTKNKISKLSNGGSWNAQVFSNVGFSTFNLSFSPSQDNKHMCMGISVVGSSNLYQTSYTSMFLAFRLSNDGTFDVMNQGRKINKNSFSYSEGSIFNLAFDKVNFTITLDGAEVGSFGFEKGLAPAYVYSLDSSFYDTGTNLTEFISFTPGANAIVGPKGRQGDTGPKGQPGANSTVKGPKGSTGAPSTVKGPKGDKSTIKGPKGHPSSVKGPRGPDGPGGPKGPAGPRGAASTVRGPAGPKGPQGVPSEKWAWRVVPNQKYRFHKTGPTNGWDFQVDLAKCGIPTSATKVVLSIHTGEADVYLWRYDDWHRIHRGVDNGNRHCYATVDLQREFNDSNQYLRENLLQMTLRFARGDDRTCATDIYGWQYYGPA